MKLLTSLLFGSLIAVAYAQPTGAPTSSALGVNSSTGAITGPVTAAAFRSGNSLLSSTEIAAGYQPKDATLTAWGNITFAADTLAYGTGADTFSTTILTSFGRSILDDANAAAVRTTIGLGNVDNTTDIGKPVSTAQAAAIAVVQADIDAHEANTSNPHSVTKAQVGLANADNTSDANKPVSTAQAAADAVVLASAATDATTKANAAQAAAISAASTDATTKANAAQAAATSAAATDATTKANAAQAAAIAASQPLDSDLTSIAALTTTSYGRSALELANAAAARTLFGVVIGTDVLAPNGNGSSLTALNATQLASGTIPDARFPSTLPALNGSALTALNASAITTGTLDAVRLPTTITQATTFSGGLSSSNSAGAAINIATNGQPGSTGTPLYTDLNFRGYNGDLRSRIRSWDESSSTGFGYLTFWTFDGTTLNEAMRLGPDKKATFNGAASFLGAGVNITSTDSSNALTVTTSASANPVMIIGGSASINGVSAAPNAAGVLVNIGHDTGSLRSLTATGAIQGAGLTSTSTINAAGDVTFNGATASPVLRIQGANANALPLIYLTSGFGGGSQQQWAIGSNNSGSAGEFFVRDSTGSLTALTITKGTGAATFSGLVTSASLNVGDGSASGNALLTVNGSTNVSNIALMRSDVSWGINNETNLRFYTRAGRTSSGGVIVAEFHNGSATLATSYFAVNSTVASTSTSTGSAVFGGGIGVAGRVTANNFYSVDGLAYNNVTTGSTSAGMTLSAVESGGGSTRVIFQDGGSNRWALGSNVNGGGFQLYDYTATAGNVFSVTAGTKAIAFAGAATAASFRPTSSTMPVIGMYAGAVEELSFSANSRKMLNLYGQYDLIDLYASVRVYGGAGSANASANLDLRAKGTAVYSNLNFASDAHGGTYASLVGESGSQTVFFNASGFVMQTGKLAIQSTTTGFLEGAEQSSDPAAPAADNGRLYFRDNGSGKTQLVARFPTGAVQLVATEP